MLLPFKTMPGICLTRLSIAAAFFISSAPGFSARAQDTHVTDVIVVFKTHFDIGYTDMASNIVSKYRTTMMDQALKVVDENRGLPSGQQFVWTLPGWPMKMITAGWPGESLERKHRVMQAFKEGRFVVHALPFTTHTELLEAEDLVRGLEFSSALSRAAATPLPRDAKMTDVPSHSWILPTLLRHAGVDFLHLGCNPASRSPHVPPLFWWEGPDGSRLLTMYSAEDYGSRLVPPPDWPHKTWLALIHTGDNHGPPTVNEVRQLLERAKRELPGANVRIGRLSDFSDAILAEKPDLRVVRGDMPDTWIHGPMSDPRGAGIARHARPALATAERLGTHLAAWGVHTPDLQKQLDRAAEDSLLYGEHTWGGAFWWIYGKYILHYGDEWKAERAAGCFSRIESSWDEHTAYIENAQRLVSVALKQEMQALADAVNVDGRRIVVFNPLPWGRDGIVTAQVHGVAGPLTEVETGKSVPIESAGTGGIRFVATEVPPCGYRTFRLAPVSKGEPGPDSALPSNAQIENAFFKLTVDQKRGVVSSWIDKRTGSELVDTNAPQGFGQYLYERFDADQVRSYVKAYVKINAEWGINELGKPTMPAAVSVPYRGLAPANFAVHVENGSIAKTVILTANAHGELSHGVTTKFILFNHKPVMDVEMTVHSKPFDSWPEAGWLCLPFNLDQPQFRLARLGSIVDPACDIVPGCNFDQIALNGGMTVTGLNGHGVGLCALDSPVVSLGTPGGWRYSKTWSPRAGRVFLNLFNNQWSTNFRLWNAGTWTSRVRLWPVAGNDLETNLATPSDEARFPLIAAVADAPAGMLPQTQSGLELSRRGVKIAAFGPNPDGTGTLLRLWESAGRSGSCTVRLPAGFKARLAQPVDLRGRPVGKPIQTTGNTYTVELKAFAPASCIFMR